jgi:hypothetical protein
MVYDRQNFAAQLLAYCDAGFLHLRTRRIVRPYMQVINIERRTIVIGCYRETIFPNVSSLSVVSWIQCVAARLVLSKSLNRHPPLWAVVCRGSNLHLIPFVYIYSVVVVLWKTWRSAHRPPPRVKTLVMPLREEGWTQSLGETFDFMYLCFVIKLYENNVPELSRRSNLI